MEDFLRRFRENLERRPEPAFEERDWEDLHGRLDRHGKKRRPAAAWWWVVLPFLLLSSGPTAFFYHKMKEARRQIDAMAMKRDTVFLTRTISRADTIYRTRILREYLP